MLAYRWMRMKQFVQIFYFDEIRTYTYMKKVIRLYSARTFFVLRQVWAWWDVRNTHSLFTTSRKVPKAVQPNPLDFPVLWCAPQLRLGILPVAAREDDPKRSPRRQGRQSGSPQLNMFEESIESNRRWNLWSSKSACCQRSIARKRRMI